MYRIFILLVFMVQVSKIFPQQKYMLCVGINNYTGSASNTITTWDGRSLKNLKGCVNDVNNISSIFIKYYGFSEANTKKLLDRQAMRDSIITNLQQFASTCKAGDYMVFFYSGHGSLVYNEKTERSLIKGYQNSIVPADAAAAKITDINNRELNDLFVQFTKKHVHLTVIMDACYSATITRGATLWEVEGTKQVEPSKTVFLKTATETRQTTLLASQGAITLGACQDNEEAKELTFSKNNFGAFSYCLCEAIKEYSKAPAEEIFNRTVSKLKYLNMQQVPVMEAAPERQKENLPGTQAGQQIPPSFSLVSYKESYQLQAGFLDGIMERDILVSRDDTKDSVQVISVDGPERSTVKPINAGGKLKNTGLKGLNAHYSVLRIAMQPDPPLKVFVDKGLPAVDLDRIIQEAAILRKNKLVKWITPSAGSLPQATIYYNVSQMVWKMNINGRLDPVVVTDVANPAALSAVKGLKVFLQLPYSNTLSNSLSQTIQNSRNRNIGLESSADDANYLLTGILDDNGKPQYGWIRMKWTSQQVDAPPLRTDFFGASGTTDSLYDRLVKLGKIAGWLTLESPLPDGTIKFPFTIKIFDTRNKLLADKKSPGKVFTGDTLKINFEKDNYSNIKWEDSARLFIYLFSMDPKGNMRLLFPGERTSIFDYPRSNNDPWLVTIRNTTPGIYHYFLLSCKERILNTNVFNQQGVITRSGDVFDNPLEALINDGGTSQRGNIRTPANWTLQRVDLETINKR